MARYDSLRTSGFLLAAFSGAFAFAACGGGENTRPEESGGAGGAGGAGTGGTLAGTAGKATGGSSGSGAGTGGSSGATAGSSGSGGSSGGSCLSTGASPLIANFDGDSTVDPTGPNNYTRSMGLLPGGTYAYVDPMDTTATIVTALTPMGHTCQGLSVTITSTSWRGSGFWTTATVDASIYTGISFWARASNITAVVVSLGTESTTMANDAGTGGPCMTTCTRPQATITLTDAWTEYELFWSRFAAGEADGVTIVADGTGLNGLDFSYTTTTGTSTAAEFVLDDMTFLTAADPGSGGTGGAGGSAGSAGTAGTAGTAGSAGMAGSAGSAGEGGASGAAGSAGMAGDAGAAGTAAGGGGQSGAAGANNGGVAGTAGAAGTSAGGTAGSN